MLATGRALAVLSPQCTTGFASRGKDLLRTDLVGATTVKDQTDFCTIPPDVSIYYESLDIVLIGGRLSRPESLLDQSGNPVFSKCQSERLAPLQLPPLPEAPLAPVDAAAVCLADEELLTWGAQATRAHASRQDGTGIRVAIVDSGIDIEHEAFRGRLKPHQLRSFVAARANTDRLGHGTHCAGTICGRTKPGSQRYGIAPGVELYVAKIFDGQLRSCDARILAALNWAVMNKCHIVSMSIGGQVQLDSPHSAIFEAAAKTALSQGTLVIAGAGNGSARAASNFMPVSHPANCPSVLSVGAVDECLKVTDSSNRGLNLEGGLVDFVAPGARIRSAIAGGGIGTMDGTSMAAPFVAAIAALWAQNDGSLRGAALWEALKRAAVPVAGDPRDFGNGLVQAPP
jgi:hypothetical protein